MNEKSGIFKILIFLLFFVSVILDDDELKINYEAKTIEDMRVGFLDTIDNGIYYIDNLQLGDGQIVGFSDMGGSMEEENSDQTGSKQTGIFTCIKNEYQNEYKFNFNKYVKAEKRFFETELFTLKQVDSDFKLRNFFVGSLLVDLQYCFIISFINNEKRMKHYVKCGNENEKILQRVENQKQKEINSNILILNKDENNNFHSRIIYEDEGVIKICSYEGDGLCIHTNNIEDLNNNGNLSTEGGMAYVDITGNCVPDILLSIDNGSQRIIKIYTVDKNNGIHKNPQEIKFENIDEWGAFSISKMNNKNGIDDDNSKLSVPMLDLFIPNKKTGKIIYYKNIISKEIGWDDDFCEKFEEIEVKGDIFKLEKTFSLSDFPIHSNYPTHIRFGDFLFDANPGIIATQVVNEKKVINLYEVNVENIKLRNTFELNKIPIQGADNNDEFEMGLFYDIEELGSMSMILCTKNGNNYFFFNKQKTKYFIKSKLISQKNDKKGYFDTNLGATFRYIYTDEVGKEHMDLSFQMAQYSDMNIPLPYGFMGLPETSYYIDYFHSISGNHYTKKEIFLDDEIKNMRQDTPIIPNTQMMIFKFRDPEEDNLIRWDIDLIVQPMDKIYIILFIVVIVLLIVLGIIIYLHVKETKEEQKEQNKFKSWFA